MEAKFLFTGAWSKDEIRFQMSENQYFDIVLYADHRHGEARARCDDSRYALVLAIVIRWDGDIRIRAQRCSKIGLVPVADIR